MRIRIETSLFIGSPPVVVPQGYCGYATPLAAVSVTFHTMNDNTFLLRLLRQRFDDIVRHNEVFHRLAQGFEDGDVRVANPAGQRA